MYPKNTDNNTVQTSVKHGMWIKTLRDMAMGMVRTPTGRGVKAGAFFVHAAGVVATKLLKDANLYDQVKQNFEAIYGPVQEYDINILEGEEDEQQDAEEDYEMLESEGVPS